MTKGTRLLLMVLVLIAVVIGMTQCIQKSIRKKKTLDQNNSGSHPTRYLDDALGVGSHS